VDCSYDPEIFRTLSRLHARAIKNGAEDFVFTNPDDTPLSQEWLHKRIWKPTLERAGLHVRGQYNIRDTFITIALSAGEDPGWVAQVCGTSEQPNNLTPCLFRQPLGVPRGADGSIEIQRLSQRLLGSRRVVERGSQPPAHLQDPR